MIKHLVLKQDAEKPVPVEVLAASIQALSEGIRKLRSGPLNDRCLYLLIQHAAPSYGSYPAKKVGIADIKAVLEGIESLEATYLKKKPSPR